MNLIQRSLAGDQAAFAELFEEHKNLVFKTAYLMPDNQQTAEDVLQEVFVQVYHSLSSYDARKAAFTTWLYRITVNHCLNLLRKKRPTLLPLSEVFGLGRRSDAIEHLGRDEAMREALSGLSDKLRPVVILRFYWDLPYAEIAEILDIPLGTVKSRLHQALTNLRDYLKEPSASALTEEVHNEL